jgi:uncharacterized protein YdaU (DUF1376 family)
MRKVRKIDWSFNEWIAETQGMTLEEEGLYCRIINRFCSRGGDFPSDPFLIAKLCNVRVQVVQRLLPKLASKFEETDGKLRSNWCETELKLAQNRLETAVKNGMNGGRPRTYGIHPVSETEKLLPLPLPDKIPESTMERSESPIPEPEVPKLAISAAKKSYAFEGDVIRLQQGHFDLWQKSFWSIPDLAAELAAIDAKAVSWPEHERRRWFGKVSGWLRSKHANLVADGAVRPGIEPPSQDENRDRALLWLQTHRWSQTWGPLPGEPGSCVSQALLADVAATEGRDLPPGKNGPAAYQARNRAEVINLPERRAAGVSAAMGAGP